MRGYVGLPARLLRACGPVNAFAACGHPGDPAVVRCQERGRGEGSCQRQQTRSVMMGA